MKTKNINQNIEKLLGITMEQCINSNSINRIDALVEETAFDVFLDGILDQHSISENTASKIEVYLNHMLMRIVPSANWKRVIEKTDHTSEEIENTLYIAMKRHFYLNSNEFPTN